MKTAALFFALSLSIVSIGCGVESDHTGTGPDEMMPKDSRDSRAPSNGETTFIVFTICKMELTFLDDSESPNIIDRIDSFNKNDKAVTVRIYDEAINKMLFERVNPSNWKSTNWVQIEKGKALRLESTTTGYDRLYPCETIHIIMPPA